MKEQKCEMTAAEGAFSEIFGYTTVQMNKDFEIEKAIIQRAREEFGHSGLSVGLGLRTLGGILGQKPSSRNTESII